MAGGIRVMRPIHLSPPWRSNLPVGRSAGCRRHHCL